MFRSKICIHAFVCLTETDCFKTTIISRKFLLYNICFDRNAKTISLSGQVGSSVIIHTTFFEVTIAQVTPQNGNHTQLMSILKSLRNLYQLTTALFGTEINGSTYSRSSHIPSFFDRAEHDLIV